MVDVQHIDVEQESDHRYILIFKKGWEDVQLNQCMLQKVLPNSVCRRPVILTLDFCSTNFKLTKTNVSKVLHVLYRTANIAKVVFVVDEVAEKAHSLLSNYQNLSGRNIVLESVKGNCG